MPQLKANLMAQVLHVAGLCALALPFFRIPVARALQTQHIISLDSRSVQDESWPLWPAGEVPGELDNVIGPEVLMPSFDDVSRRCGPGDPSPDYLNVTSPALYPFLGDGSSNLSTSMTLLVIPGGGFHHLAWEKEGTDIAVWLNSLGYTAYVLKYRVPLRPWLDDSTISNSGPGQVDGRRAVRMLRHRLPSEMRVGAIGFSAGGILTAWLGSGDEGESQRPHFDAVDEESALLDFQLLIYGGTPVPYIAQDSKDHLTPPPSFLAGAVDDQCVPAESMAATAAVLTLLNASVERHEYGSGLHGYGRCAVWKDPRGEPYEACQWPKDAAVWLSNLANLSAQTSLALATF